MTEETLLKEAVLSLAHDLEEAAKNGRPFSPQNLGVYINRLKELQAQFCPEAIRDNLTQEIRAWVLAARETFLTTDIQRELDLKAREARKKLSVVLGRLEKEGLIVKTGRRRGEYRTVDKHALTLDWEEADTSQVYGITWPFGLEKIVKLYPKNLVVLAGDSNSGKTAFLLNVVVKNIDRFEIDYFTNELGPEELKERLLNFQEAGTSLQAFQRCNFLSRTENYLDVIHPDRLTIIDYLMVTKDAYMIGDELDAIFRKLNQGLAIIAIQKKKGELLGRGKDFALERPRLYLTMENGRLNIVKAKNWRDKTVNPNGISIPFTLWGGCKFTPLHLPKVLL